MTMKRYGPLAFLICTFVCGPAASAEHDVAPERVAALARALRSMVLLHLPDPLIDKRRHWGEQKEFRNGVTWRKKGLLRKPVWQIKSKNHGKWEHYTVKIIRPDRTLQLAIKNMQNPTPGRFIFELWVVVDVHLFYEQQNWRRGVRTLSHSAQGRCKVVIGLLCEASSRLERSKGLLPDVVLSIGAKKSHIDYTGLHITHALGVGGDVAEWVGKVGDKIFRQWLTGERRKLLGKANAAILKAAKTREVRLSLSKLLEK